MLSRLSIHLFGFCKGVYTEFVALPLHSGGFGELTSAFSLHPVTPPIQSVLRFARHMRVSDNPALRMDIVQLTTAKIPPGVLTRARAVTAAA
jgi:hypothetical protein